MLQTLSIQHTRNLTDVSCHLHPKLNIFCGANGSGKSSILEAIHLLGLSRSFRSRHNKHIIQYEQEQMVIVGKLLARNKLVHTIGLTRSQDNKNVAHLDGDVILNSSTLAQHLPLQLLEPQSFELLNGSPNTRRQFIDWGVFHVEHQFYDSWRKVQRIIKQRNAMLKQSCKLKDVAIWDQELITHGEHLDQFRLQYLDRLKPLIHNMLEKLAPNLIDSLDMKYARGWNQQISLSEALAKHFPQDSLKGYTHVGPHRATMQIIYHGQPAHLLLSKGQQKCVVCSLRLAQSVLFDQHHDIPCLFLMDDLAAELDQTHQARVAEILLGLDNQIFATCIDPKYLCAFTDKQPEHTMFHVEHGCVSSAK